MSYLHEGKRAEAREHFQNVVELDMLTDTILNLAAGHLYRMERDMAWPSLRSDISTSEEKPNQTVTIRE